TGPTFAAIAFLTGPGNDDNVAVVRFERCLALKGGVPNDEVLHGHPLYDKGLTFYAAHEVEHSSWIRDLIAISGVHRQFDPKTWTRMRHLIFTFQDETVEVVAEGWTVESGNDGLSGAAT